MLAPQPRQIGGIEPGRPRHWPAAAGPRPIGPRRTSAPAGCGRDCARHRPRGRAHGAPARVRSAALERPVPRGRAVAGSARRAGSECLAENGRAHCRRPGLPAPARRIRCPAFEAHGRRPGRPHRRQQSAPRCGAAGHRRRRARAGAAGGRAQAWRQPSRLATPVARVRRPPGPGRQRRRAGRAARSMDLAPFGLELVDQLLV